MTKKFVLSILAGVFAAPFFLQAQSGDLPADARVGQCYAKCMIPDVYETVTEQILVKEASSKIEVVSAQYETVTERIMIKEPYNVLKVIPPSYTTVTEELLVKEASSKLIPVSPVYETVSEQIQISPAITKWVKGKATRDCISENPEDCRVWCLKEIPAEYRTVSRKVLKSPSSVKEVEIPAEYRTIKKTVVQTPAQVQEETIPAEYKTVSKKVVATPAQTLSKEIPAEFKTVSSKQLVSSGGMTEWREVLCESKSNRDYIQRIQIALRDKGYNPGPIDGVIGTETRAAVRAFQTDNGLAVGVEGRSIPYETLKALGIN